MPKMTGTEKAKTIDRSAYHYGDNASALDNESLSKALYDMATSDDKPWLNACMIEAARRLKSDYDDYWELAKAIGDKTIDDVKVAQFVSHLVEQYLTMKRQVEEANNKADIAEANRGVSRIAYDAECQKTVALQKKLADIQKELADLKLKKEAEEEPQPTRAKSWRWRFWHMTDDGSEKATMPSSTPFTV